ncbi:MAG TPA: ABC transporter permease [Candidatus Binatia bacterium]|nr:ABC transporter permease [Candidatus Binatia bacterium]
MTPAVARAAARVGPAVLAVATALSLAAALAAIAGSDPATAVRALVLGSLGSTANVADTLVRSAPLLLCGAAVMLAFRSGIFNIGADGQFLAGALAATAVATRIRPFPGQFACVLIAGALAGGAWAIVPAAFRIRRDVSEVITTILLNFVALYLVSWAVTGPLQESSRAYPQSAAIPETARLARFLHGTGDRLHAGIPLAFGLAAATGGLLSFTTFGLRLRAAGLNAPAARLAGFPVRRDLAVAFALSGALAGLAGAVELAGVTHRLFDRFSPGYGYTAIAVALLGNLRTPGTIAAALFFAALGAGASAMERSAGVSAVIAVAVQGATLLAVAATGAPALARVVQRARGRGEAAASETEAAAAAGAPRGA